MRNFHSDWQSIIEWEINHQPEADRWWSDVPLLTEGSEPRRLHYSLEGRTVLSIPTWGICEVGCDYWIQFYFVDGVGYGYC